MSIILLIFIAFFIAFLVSLSIVSRSESAMAPLAKSLLAVLLGLMALFCIYGFMASFEPSENAMAFRIGYAVIFFVLTGLIIWMLRSRKSSGGG